MNFLLVGRQIFRHRRRRQTYTWYFVSYLFFGTPETFKLFKLVSRMGKLLNDLKFMIENNNDPSLTELIRLLMLFVISAAKKNHKIQFIIAIGAVHVV